MKKKFVKWGPANGCGMVHEPLEGFGKNIEEMLMDAEPNEEWTVEIVEMTEEEFKKLPEFTGF